MYMIRVFTYGTNHLHARLLWSITVYSKRTHSTVREHILQYGTNHLHARLLWSMTA